MKIIILFCLLFAGIAVSAQDTLYLVRQYDGSKSFWLVTKEDTTLISAYRNGQKATERKMKNAQVTGTYKRWYENGNLMWEKELVNGKAEGSTVFYDQKGKRVAELIYHEGQIKDTVYIKEKTHLIFGKVTYESTVYGGMERADGSSNISHSSGPWMNCFMYAAKVDSIKKPELIQTYRTDHEGEFFILAPVAKVGFFPASTDINKLKPGEFYPPAGASMSGHEGWNMTKPLTVLATDKLLFISLHHTSVGYAP